jgi:hypothetical protein
MWALFWALVPESQRWRTCQDSSEIRGFSAHAQVLTTTLGVPCSPERRLGAVKDGKPSQPPQTCVFLTACGFLASAPSDGDGSRLQIGCSSPLEFSDLVLLGFAAFANRSMDGVIPNLWSANWRALKTTR